MSKHTVVYLSPVHKHQEHRNGEVTTIIKALEGRALEGGKDTRVWLVFEAGQVERWLDARQGLGPK